MLEKEKFMLEALKQAKKAYNNHSRRKIAFFFD